MSGVRCVCLFCFFFFCSGIFNNSFAQPEVMAWGNLTGIRVEGQLMEFETSICIVNNDWSHITRTGKERQRPKYSREGEKQLITTGFSGVNFSEVVENRGNGIAVVSVKTSSDIDTLVEGVFLCVDLPLKYYSSGILQFKEAFPAGKSLLPVSSIQHKNKNPLELSATGLTMISDTRQLQITFNSKTKVFVKTNDKNSGIEVFIKLSGPQVRKGEETESIFTLKATGEINHDPVVIDIDIKNPGRNFAGLGGNFRLQNPKTDPPVIQYCLDSLRVAWGRVEMPWQLWHPDENIDPVSEAQKGNLNPRVKAAMEMAQRLAKMGMPVIVSDWSAPKWAILGDPRDAYRYRSKGIFGYPLNPEKMDKIYRSICDYLVYLKQHYGVEAAMFSFNESDLGINVRHTGEEHAIFIKELGAELASRGLATKLLLGDNSDATTFEFIIPAMNDPETHKYIGAVSFHSWRGCTNETLEKWAGAAKALNLPLIIGEGSTDAAAWNYPSIFSEQSFALYEINLYTRICAICQPLSILQWQLTADYSVLTGNGVFGTKGPLQPTQRFWNLKQLASTPENSFSIPFTCDKEVVNSAVFGNIARNEYAVHIVNNGAECEATVTGIPEGVSKFNVFVTDSKLEMKNTGEIKVVNGEVKFLLHPAGFTSLISK